MLARKGERGGRVGSIKYLHPCSRLFVGDEVGWDGMG